MEQCQHCNGFVPAPSTNCPHCEQALEMPILQKSPSLKKAGWKQKLAMATGVGSIMFTLMACYGAPPPQPCTETIDKDKDGFVVCKNKSQQVSLEKRDCNDDDKTIHPGAEDKKGDNIDQNCDGADGTLK